MSVTNFATLIALLLFSWASHGEIYVSKFFDQSIAHDKNDPQGSFQQRYFISKNFVKESGAPLFIYLCGEWECTTPENSAVAALAKERGGYLIALEHRYYGLSSPFKWLTKKNLSYLSVELAIKDVANFTRSLQKEFMPEAIYLFGVSYAGTLAALTKIVAPYLIDGVWAASSPIFFPTTTPFHEDFFRRQAEKKSNECLSRWDDFVEQMRDNRRFDKGTLLTLISLGANTSCELLSLNKTSNLDSDWSFEKADQELEASPLNPIRPFIYQQCKELGMFVTVQEIIDEKWFENHCVGIFGITAQERERAQIQLEALASIAINDTSILFTGFMEDPWMALSAPNAVLLNGFAHGDEMMTTKYVELLKKMPF